MIKKKILLLFFSLFIFSCSNFEFVYNSPDELNNIKNKTLLSVIGDDANIIDAYAKKSINLPGDTPDFHLTISSEKTVKAIIIDKDATASKFSVEYQLNYILKNLKESCTVTNKTIKNQTTYNSKSEGYSFGSDLSKNEVSTSILQSNIDNFFNDIVVSKINLNCK